MKRNLSDVQTIDQDSADPIDFRYIIKQLMQIPVLVAALGYLVDMYDLFLFSVVRVPSLL